MITWEYLAGFFDGEGTARIPLGSSSSLSPTWQVVQGGGRGQKLLAEIAEFLTQNGVTKYTLYSRRQNYPEAGIKSRLEMWTLGIYKRNDVLMVCRRLFPFLHIKKVEVQDIIRYCSLFPALNTGPAWRMLNREGAAKRRLPPGVALERSRASAKKYQAEHYEKMRIYRRDWKRMRRAKDCQTNLAMRAIT